MRLKKGICLLLASILAFGCLAMDAGAVQTETGADTLVIERASGRFSVDVSKQSTFSADSTFPLDIGDTVTITATYTPPVRQHGFWPDRTGRIVLFSPGAAGQL